MWRLMGLNIHPENLWKKQAVPAGVSAGAGAAAAAAAAGAGLGEEPAMLTPSPLPGKLQGHTISIHRNAPHCTLRDLLMRLLQSSTEPMALPLPQQGLDVVEPAKGVRVLLCVGGLLQGRVDRKIIARCLVPGSSTPRACDLAPK